MNIFNLSKEQTHDILTDELQSEILKAFNKDGYVILENVFDKDLISNINNYFQRNYSEYFADKIFDNALRVDNKRYQVTLELKDVFNNEYLYANPIILPLISKLLNTKIVIDDISCVISLPGSTTMHTHRDGIIFPENPLAHLMPAHAIGVLIPLIPFTKEVGPTRYWPGSHRNHLTAKDSLNAPFIEPEIDAGSVILMDYRLLHSGNPNNSNVVRPLLYINYCVNWYLDSNNFSIQPHYLMDDENFSKVADNFKSLFQRRNLKLASIK